ncbi:hypothetical protein K1J08_06810 [Streptococcus sanguinis]|uniref:DUF6287 domain-containing protein n=1 Tax=Streptococcus sanguinis TaxID=1305 RepID=UPI001CBDAE00|nr:DUF6287 domain-containing protein [Streptococcus sanguinis]MBZ2038541.1 hypothetical protein [Streptococcus sanguinis]MBZ2070970.1 hypothetical protein [Streptococcus sanguinis]
MKKWLIILVGGLVALLVLVTCNQKKEQTNPASNSSKVSSTSSASSKKSTKETSKGEKETASTSSLDMKAIASGDFSSMIGTWQDAKGNSYTFDASGIESDVAKLETGDYSGPDENGIYRAGIRWKNQTGAAFLIIPAGKSLPAGETVNGTDPTDTSQDRFIITQSVSEHPDVFYRVK